MEELHAQLEQLHSALAVAGDEDRPALQELIQGLQELIGSGADEGQGQRNLLYTTSAEASGSEYNGASSSAPLTDEDEEFLRFQAEMKALECNGSVDNAENDSTLDYDSSNATVEELLSTQNRPEDSEVNESSLHDSIREDLAALEGMKCKAPFEHHWGQIGYYNAIVFCVEPLSSEDSTSSMESILVRVIFTQPLSDKMRPCPFFLEGRCRFEEGCKYSHGEAISLSQLQEYKEPDFASLASGSRILAKYSDGLWYRGTIRKILESGDCELKFDSYNETITVPLHDTFPLHDSKDGTDESNDSDSGSDLEPELDVPNEDEVPIVWSNMTGKSALGLWEQHTKGIGSKLMAKMGYVLGTGLGKNGEGRVEPVDAVILPPGKSLDRCMELKERAGASGQNIFSVERRLKQMQRKEKLRAEKADERIAESQSMFSFLNAKLNLSKNKKGKLQQQNEVNKDSCVSLSKKLLKLDESVRQTKKDILKCREGMKRHEGRDKATVEKLKAKLHNLEQHLGDLKSTEVRIASEQKNRSDKKKLAIF